MSWRDWGAPGAWHTLTGAERLLAVVCLVYPFRILLDTAAQTPLHLGFACFAAVGLYVVVTVRELPPGFPEALDLAVAAFVAVAIVELFVTSGPTPLALKGFSVETRFAVFYGVARLLRVRREFAVWLLGATIVLGILAAVLGIVEHHVKWGTLLSAIGATPDRRFWKLGLPRLYSFPLSPVGAAYMLFLALAATLMLVAEGRRLCLVVVTVVLLWQALPLTLMRTALALAALVTVAFAVLERKRGRWFLAVSVAAAVLGGYTFWLRGWTPPLVNYAQVGGTLSDASAVEHKGAITNGFQRIVAEPWGYGFGQAGHLAMRWGGVFPRDDTYPVTLGIQMGVPGLAVFFAVVLLSGRIWVRMLRSADDRKRALGFAGLTIWLGLAAGSIFHATFTMIVPQLYFWLLTGAAANMLHGETEGADRVHPR